MPSMILDGRARFGVPIADFYRQEKLVLRLARRGILIPPTKDVADGATPALAYVNPLMDGSVRWIANCPSCREEGVTTAEYVWLETPLFFCVRCGNADIGNRWRPVEIPKQRAAIERTLLARPDPETRAWLPGETVQALRQQNAALKGGDG
jgi:hypothetical protein